jgi:amino acid adenylation domain-containing protein
MAMTGSVGALVGNPLSLDQLRLWRALVACPAQSFRSYGIVKAAGGLSLPRLREAFEQVSRDHDLLRSRLVSIPGMVYPVLMAGNAGPVVYRDMGSLGGDEDRAVDRMGQELASSRFSLEESSLVDVCFGRLGDRGVLWGLAIPAFLADGPSVEMLLEQVSLVASDMEAGASGRARQSAPLSYGAICQWRERLVESEEAGVGKRLWQERLASYDSALRETILPAARGNPFTQSPDVHRVSTRTSADLAARLAGPGGSASASRFFAAWYFLLWKLCNGPAADFYVAAQFDGRSVTDLAGAIGPLERFLPIAATVNPGQAFRRLCDDLAEQIEQANEWQDCFSWSGLDDLEDGSARIRSFDYCFDYCSGFVESAATLALRRRYSRSEQYQLKLDVLCSHGHGCELALYHDPRHISHDQASELLRAYRHVLEQAAGDDTIRLQDLKWREADRADTDATAAGRPVSARPIEPVSDRFSRVAAQYPDRIALAGERQSLSYARLNERSDALAQAIRRRAPAPESCIAMIGGLSFNTIIGLVAILKAGHHFVYIDPEHPPARTLKLLRECGATVMLHDGGPSETRARALTDTLGLDDASVIDVDDELSGREAPRGGHRAHAVHPEQLAYVTYTSGSTGEPNGVMISHASLADQMEWLVREFRFSCDDSWLLKTPLGFDASIWEWMTPLCVGGTLVFGGQKLHLDPTRIATRIRDHRVTALQGVPSLLRIMIDEARPEELSSLRYVFAGGEALPPDLCRAIGERWAATLINLYGPTETTINATSWEAPRRLAPWADASIGRPAAGMRAWVLDTLLQPLPPNFMGELYLTGTGLARGYARKPGVTAEKFLPARLGAGQRMYRTGDLVSRDDDGQLFYWGRRDNQVKLRGYRVELGEVEALLSSHDAIKTTAACICAATDNADHAQLIAYVVPRDPARRPDTQDLREYLRARLPEYMVPASIIALDGLPLRPSGKVDRKMLASPDFVDLHRTSAYAAPQTSTQETLCDIWRRILDLETVGIGDDFLKLGGQSLLVTRLVGHVREALGIEISPRLVFDFPVLRDFAEQIDRLQSSKAVRDNGADERRSPRMKANDAP